MPSATAIDVAQENIPPTQKPAMGKANVPPVKHTLTGPGPQKKISRRGSKPILNWLQRKLAGSVRARRGEPLSSQSGEAGRGKGRGTGSAPSRSSTRVVSSPLPRNSTNIKNNEVIPPNRRNTISLLDDDDGPRRFDSPTTNDDISSYQLSLEERASQADDDASLRPIPPSAPPSPSPSRSSSSYMSDPRTFRSLAASTKPTTVLSVDLNGGVAHIAEAPNSSPMARLHPHSRTGSTNTNSGIASGPPITFSALPPSTPDPSSRPSSLLNPNNLHTSNVPLTSVQAPLHTTHHPRNNPRPSSPPLDNASMLTLASSAFGMPGPRVDASLRSAPLSAGGGPSDSISHFGGTSLNFADAESTNVLGFDERLDERDVDASVRALRPRSSRRGSWESEVSRWSARGLHGTSSVARDTSLWTATSLRDDQGTENDTRKDDGTFESQSVTSKSMPSPSTIDESAQGTSSSPADSLPEHPLGTEKTPKEERDELTVLSPTTTENESGGDSKSDGQVVAEKVAAVEPKDDGNKSLNPSE